MKHSPAVRQVGLRAAVVLADMIGYLAVPASVLALSRGHVDAAIAASTLASASALLRAFLVGGVVAAAVRSTWRAVIAAARARPIETLATRREDEQSAVVLINAARDVAMYEATAVPQVVAKASALAAVVAATFVLLGPGWLALGALALAPVAAFAAWSGGRVRRAQREAWHAFTDLGLLVRVLVEAGAELRAHDREEGLVEKLVDRADVMARAERVVGFWSALATVAPAGFAVLLLAGPVRAGVAWIVAALAGPRATDVGVLGATSLLLGLGLARAVELVVRSTPSRRVLEAFLAAGTSRPVQRPVGGAVVDVGTAAMELEGVSYAYPGAAFATPHDVSLRWAPGEGLALLGENGSGKSTLALLLLGLLRPTAGRITVGGVPLAEIDGVAWHRRIAYVPQAPFVAPGCSVAWHVRLLAGDVVDAELEAALREVGLFDALVEHAKRRGVQPLDVPAGELSGGERQRMHLARALVQDADFVLLDEPEIGIDRSGRDLLRRLLASLATTRRVLVIAHDEAIVPESFARVVCARFSMAA
jgi:ABC-type multidrug transport system fused ATPase/permease subunit